MPNILLTGGSGYIGGEILAQLDESTNKPFKNSVQVFTVYRKEEHAKILSGLGYKPVKLDLSDLDAVKLFIRDNKIEIVVELTEPFGADLPLACIEALKEVSPRAALISTGGAKVFASFSGHDTSKTLYDDSDPLDSALTPKREWAVSEIAQTNERKILSAASASSVSAHIVIPPIVYGQSRTFGNPVSIQILGLTKVLTHFQKPLVIPGTDDQAQTYAICHVEDVAGLYVALLKKLVGGEGAASGVYFAENGVADWKVLVREFAKGLNIPGEVEAASEGEMGEMVGVLGVEDVSWVRPWIGGRTNISGRAGRKIGWKPKYGVEHMYAVASEEAKHMSRHI